MRLPLALVLCHAALLFFLTSSASAEAIFTIGEATAAPGESVVVVPIHIEIDPEEDLFRGFELTVSFDPAVLGGVSIVPVDDADFHRHLQPWKYVNEGNVGAAIIWSLFDGDFGFPGGIAAELRCCVLEGAAPGTYPLEILPTAELTISRGEMRTVYTVGGMSQVPFLQGGSITIDGDPVSGSDCEPDPREPPDVPPLPPPPDVFEAVFTLGDVTARPGSSVRIPFTILGNAECPSFSFSIDFDESILEGTRVEEVHERADGAEYDFRIYRFNNDDNTPGNAGVDEGFVAGAAIFNFDDRGDNLPRDVETEVLAFHLAVRQGAPPATTPLRFLDGASTGGEPIRNVATLHHVSVDPVENPSMVLINGLLEIIGDASAFVRGDTNADGSLNLTDAQVILNYLFKGGRPPECYDAADTNDDGRLNLVDAVFELRFLFSGGSTIPPPLDEPGPDPTPDGMTCLSLSS